MTPVDTTAERADLYVLGLCDPAEAAALEAEMTTNASLAAAVDAARARFAPIDDTADPVTPSESLWPAIEKALDAEAPAAPARPASPQPAPAARRPAARSTGRRDASAGRWRMAALTAVAASVLLAIGLAWRVLVVETPMVVAVLLDDERRPVAIVEDFGDSGQRITPLTPVAAADGGSFQVWTKFSDEVGPVSLGVLEALRTTTLDRDGLPPPEEGQLYEITLEPPGGSPTGKPTGPIIGKGFASPPG